MRDTVKYVMVDGRAKTCVFSYDKPVPFHKLFFYKSKTDPEYVLLQVQGDNIAFNIYRFRIKNNLRGLLTTLKQIFDY
jgi:hypothetical protein